MSPIAIWLSSATGSPSASPGAVLDSMKEATDAVVTEGAKNPFKTLIEPVFEFFTYIQNNFVDILWRFLLIVLVILLSKLLLNIISKITGWRMRVNQAKPVGQRNGRVESMMTLIRSSARYIIFIMAFLIIMQIILTKPGDDTNVFYLFFGAFGAGAVAIGFGTQDIVKDIVNGILMSFENQFNVGEYIKTDEFEGTVTAMALRVTYLRNPKGQQVIVPNRSINRLVNFSRGSQTVYVPIPTPYDSDTESIISLLSRTMEAWSAENENILLEPAIVQGVVEFSERSTDIQIMCKAKSLKGWEAERSIRLAAKEAMDAAGIEMPYQRFMVDPEETIFQHNDNSSAGFEYQQAKPKAARTEQKPQRVEKPLWQKEEYQQSKNKIKSSDDNEVYHGDDE